MAVPPWSFKVAACARMGFPYGHGTRVENGLYRGERVRSVLVAIERRNGSVSQTSYDRDRVFRTRERKEIEKRERELISLMVLGKTAAKSDETFFFPHAHLSLFLSLSTTLPVKP